MDSAVRSSKRESKMNEDKIQALKQVAEAAFAAHEAKKAELIEAGMNAAQRRKALKSLHEAKNAAHAEYARFAKGEINRELDKIIAAGAEERREAAIARSPWKQAKRAAGLL